MKHRGKIRIKSKGSTLLLAIIISLAMIVFAIAFLQIGSSGISGFVKNMEYEKASWIARAGISSALHDLRSNWFSNVDQIIEEKFSGGLYKTAIINLPYRNGFHRVFIVSLGYYPAPSEVKGDLSKLKRVCLTAEIEMATSSDYGYFSVSKKTLLPVYDQEFIGPVYINGDAVTGAGYKAGYFLKDSMTAGPVFSVNGTLSIKDLSDPVGLSAGLFFGMKKDIFPSRLKSFEETALLDSKGFISKNGLKGWAKGLYNPEDIAKDNEYAQDEYFIVVKKNGAPDYSELENFSNLEGHGNKYFGRKQGQDLKEIKRTVEGKGAFDGSFNPALFERPEVEKEEGRIGFKPNGFEVPINDTRDLTYAPFLYLKYTLLESVVTSRFAPVLGFYNGTQAVKLDRNGRKFIVSYPFIWQNFRFFAQPMNNGKILGRERYSRTFKAPFPVNGTLVPGGSFAEDPDFIERVSVVVYSKESKEVWLSVKSLDAAGPKDNVFQPDWPSGSLKFGNGVNGKKLPEDSIVTISATREKYFEASAFVFGLDPFVTVSVLDLSNSALLRSYRCKECIKSEHAVVYSAESLLVYGNPSVPVTIFCEKDVYLGPVNTDYLNPADPELKSVLNGPKLNDPKAEPVGLITKGTLWYDFTLAPLISPGKSPVTAFNRFAPPGVKKNYILNKVALVSPYTRKIGSTGFSLSGGEERLGILLSAPDGFTGVFPVLDNCNYEQTIIGSIYKDDCGKVLPEFTGRFYDSISPLVFYPGSFRVSPPLHMPVMLNVEQNGRGDTLLAEAIIKKFSGLLLNEDKENFSGLEEEIKELMKATEE